MHRKVDFGIHVLAVDHDSGPRERCPCSVSFICKGEHRRAAHRRAATHRHFHGHRWPPRWRWRRRPCTKREMDRERERKREHSRTSDYALTCAATAMVINYKGRLERHACFPGWESVHFRTCPFALPSFSLSEKTRRCCLGERRWPLDDTLAACLFPSLHSRLAAPLLCVRCSRRTSYH